MVDHMFFFFISCMVVRERKKNTNTEQQKRRKRNKLTINHEVQLVRKWVGCTCFPKHVKDKLMHESEKKFEVVLR